MWLDMGEYSPSSFWDYSIKELYEIFEAYSRRVETRFKEKLILNNLLARQIGEQVAALFDKENKVTPIWDYYPNLFVDEKAKYEAEQRDMKWKIYKAQMESYMQSKGVK